MATHRTQASETADLADVLYTVMPMVVEHVNERLEELNMTNTDYWALRSVEGPMPMKDLAHCMNIDPSYVTLVADRLEELGLVERQPHPTDRRVKNLVPTTKGKQFKKTIPDILWKEPSMFSNLTASERAQLMDLLTKLVPGGNHDDPSPTD